MVTLLSLLSALEPAAETLKTVSLAAADAPFAALQPGLPSNTGLIWALAIPVALAGAALLLKRRAPPVRQLQILESTNLGDHRSLVLAQLGGETLLLASSAAGITLLAARPLPARGGPTPPPAAVLPFEPPAPVLTRPRLVEEPPRLQTPVPQSFTSFLEEGAEDQELRRKLAAGRRAWVQGATP